MQKVFKMMDEHKAIPHHRLSKALLEEFYQHVVNGEQNARDAVEYLENEDA